MPRVLALAIVAVALRVIALPAVMVVTDAAPALADTLVRQADVDALLESARKTRAYADTLQRQAEGWRKLAVDNRANAAAARTSEVRNGWLRDARGNELQARELEDQAARERKRADEEEARARTLQGEVDRDRQRQERERALQEERQREFDARQQAEHVEPAPEKLSLEDALGYWRFDDDQNPFVIVIEDPEFEAYRYRLEAHTRERVWKGAYEPSEPGEPSRQNPARLTFRYKPKADEMNPEIPAWARTQLEGELEWVIEINEPRTCGGEHLDLAWYPGEVTWREQTDGAPAKAWISGRGKPRYRTLVPERFEPPELFAATMVRLRLPGQEERAAMASDAAEQAGVDLGNELPLQALFHGQPFFVDVFLPYAVAKEKGEHLIVEIRGLAGSGSASRALRSGAMRKGYPVKYTHYEPLVIGQGPPFMSQSWLNEVGSMQSRLEFLPANGESVEFVYGDAKTIVPVFTDVEQFKLSQYLAAIARLRGFFSSLLVLPHVTDKARRSAHWRLLMLRNLEAMLTFEERPAWLKVALAKHYLGYPGEAVRLMAGGPRLEAIDSKDRDGSKDIDGIELGGSGLATMSDSARARRIEDLESWGSRSVKGLTRMFRDFPLTDEERLGDNDKSGRFKGVVWTSNLERATTLWLIDDLWSKRVRTAFDHFHVNLTKGLYDWTLSLAEVGVGNFKIGVGDIYTVLSGTDPYGRKVTKGQKLEIVAMAFFSSLLDYSKSRYYQQAAGGRLGYLAPGDRAMTVTDAVEALRGRVIQSQKFRNPGVDGKPPPEFPDSVSEKQKTSAVPVLAEQGRIDNTRLHASCAEPAPLAPPRSNLPPILDGSGLPPHDVSDLDIVRARYGDKASYDTSAERLGEPAQFQTCNTDAVVIGLTEETGKVYNPIGVLRKLAENDAFEGKLRDMASEQHPLVYGYEERFAVRFAQLEGAETLQLPSGQKLSLRALENWRERGWRVKLVMHARDQQDPQADLHAIDFTKVNRGERGCVDSVSITDPGIQRRVDLPWDDLRDRLADYPVLLYRPSEGTGGMKPAAAAPPSMPDQLGSPPRTGPSREDAGADKPERPRVEEFDPTASDDDIADTYRARWQLRGEDPRAVVRRLEAKRDRSAGDEVELRSARIALRAHREILERGERLKVLRARQAEAPEFDFSRLARQPQPQRNVIDARNPRRYVVEDDVDYIERVMDDTSITPTQNQVWASTINKYVQEFLDRKISDSANKYDVELIYREGPSGASPLAVATAPGAYGVHVGGSGHHRLIAAAIVSRLTGRPIFGGEEAIIPMSEVTVKHVSEVRAERQPKGSWRFLVNP